MNKTDVIKKLTERTDLSTKQASAAVEGFMDIVIDAMREGEKILFLNFGTFEARQRLPRQGKNPITGEFINIPGCKVPAFKPAKVLKDKINK